ncbi:MAG: hypothetical protein KGQ41_09560 [Alphaproteobacteria bacterium]|nr:hypothetical protein [Alphaproteobacteria bacterium]
MRLLIAGMAALALNIAAAKAEPTGGPIDPDTGKTYVFTPEQERVLDALVTKCEEDGDPAGECDVSIPYIYMMNLKAQPKKPAVTFGLG